MNDSPGHIDRYFNGELTPGEKIAFENRCLSDQAFARMVAIYVLLHDKLKQEWAAGKKQEFAKLAPGDFSSDSAAFRMNGDHDKNISYGAEKKKIPPIVSNRENKTLHTFANKNDTNAIILKKEEKRSKNSRFLKMLTVAAVASGIVALSIVTYMQKGKDYSVVSSNSKNAGSGTKRSHPPGTVVPDSERSDPGKVKKILKGSAKEEGKRLFAQSFQPDALPGETQGILEDAFEYYEKGNYKHAILEYEKSITVVEHLDTRMPGDDKDQEEKQHLLFYAHYYNALSYLAEGKAVKAISELKAIEKSPGNFWHGKMQWYLALAYLQTGQVEKAEALLKQISVNKQAKEYMQKAIRLTSELHESL